MLLFKLKGKQQSGFCITQRTFTNEEKGSEGTNS